ncbi:UDP-glucuronosyltransferase 1A10-like [Lytechinus pictus]|uniref:UDP-glucuronosyltransferase 1A10-like n=1 Tax=Lytechinus pictus TaxID=7653 RepID=UPI0030BA1C5A
MAVLGLGLIEVSYGSNILIFSGYGEGSHFMTAALVGKELIRRGHNVTVLISNAYEHRANETKYKDLRFEIFKHNDPPEVVRNRQEHFAKSVFEGTAMTEFFMNMSIVLDWFVDDCHALFNDEPLLKRLRQANFDLAFVDPVWTCSLLVAEYAAKRHVSFMATTWMNFIPRVTGNPSNTAFVPEWSTGFTNKMTFAQRVINSVALAFSVWMTSSTDSTSIIQQTHRICPDLQLYQLYQRSHLLLVNVDFAMEYPIPVMPHVIPVGGLSAEPANNLSLKKLVKNAGDV